MGMKIMNLMLLLRQTCICHKTICMTITQKVNPVCEFGLDKSVWSLQDERRDSNECAIDVRKWVAFLKPVLLRLTINAK